MNKNIGFIPIRSGSKGIKDKNIKMLAGKPLCCHIIDEALKSDLDVVIPFVDSNEYADIIDQFSAHRKLLTVFRKDADDEQTTEEAMLEYFGNQKGDISIVLLQATSPFTTAKDINSAIELSENSKYDVISVVKDHPHLYVEAVGELIPLFEERIRRQLSEVYRETGSIYITTLERLNKHHVRASYPMVKYVMSYNNQFEVDSEDDFKLVEMIFNKETC